MSPRNRPGRKKRTLRSVKNILSKVRRGRRPQRRITSVLRTRRKPRTRYGDEDETPSTTSADIQASNSGLLPEQQHLRRRQDQPQDDHDSFFNRLAQPFKKIRDNLIFPYALRSVASSVSKPVISKDVQVLTTTERKRNALYSSNTFNPNKEKRLPGKRMIIIDGSNVAYAHSCNKFFSVKGIEIALQYFNKMGHEAKAVVPQHRLRQAASSDPELLASLHRQGKIVLTPCKNLQGKSTVSYDDRFILQLAVEFDAAVVSNDNFNDLVTEHPAFRKVIESRVIGYTWCKDVFMLPKDPYGRNGPSLSVILNRI